MVRLVLAGSDVADLRRAEAILSSKGWLDRVEVVKRESQVLEILKAPSVPGLATVIIAQQVRLCPFPTQSCHTRLGRGDAACKTVLRLLLRIHIDHSLLLRWRPAYSLHAGLFRHFSIPVGTLHREATLPAMIRWMH
jgi:hypothetical protein